MSKVLSLAVVISVHSVVTSCGQAPSFSDKEHTSFLTPQTDSPSEALAQSKGKVPKQNQNEDRVSVEDKIQEREINSDIVIENETRVIPNDESNRDRDVPKKIDFVEIRDSFIQVADDSQNQKLDILVVIDNSSSMAEEQAKLAHLSPLLGFVDKSDWRILVVTTDFSEYSPRLILDKKDTRYSLEEKKSIFHQTVSTIGTDGSGTEQGLGMMLRGLRRMNMPQQNASWMRPGATLATLIVSDEDNCSDGRYCRATPEDILEFFSLKKSGGQIRSGRVYGIIKQPDDDCPDAKTVGREYIRAVQASNGVSGSICAESYDPILSSISADISLQMDISFTLSQKSFDGILVIKVNGQPYKGGYKLKDKILQLSIPQPAGSVIDVFYTTKIDPN